MLGRGNRAFIGSDRFDRLTRDVMEVSPMAEHAGFENRICQSGGCIVLERLVEPLTGGVGPPQQVIHAAHPVVEIDQ